MAKRKKKGKIVVIGNNKGGCGKTSTAANLAAALALMNKYTDNKKRAPKLKVLFMDVDPQSDGTVALMPKGTHSQGSNPQVGYSIYHLIDPRLADERPHVKDCIYETIHENLHIIPNIPQTDGLDIPLARQIPDSYHALRNAIYDYATEHYDVTIIDCPPTLSLFLTLAMVCGDILVIPTTVGSSRSSNGVANILNFKKAIEPINKNLKFFKIILNRLDRRKKAHKTNERILRETYDADCFFKSTIPTSAYLEEAESLEGETLFSVQPNHLSTNAFRRIARELYGYIEKCRNI